VHIKSAMLFSTLQEPRTRLFPRRTSGLSKRVVNFTESEMYRGCKKCTHIYIITVAHFWHPLYLLAKSFFPPENIPLKVGRVLNL
jgi:hypothetical protein